MSHPSEIAPYQTSKDYALLAKLAKEQSIICVVDYVYPDSALPLRDVAQTGYQKYKHNEHFQIGVRGVGYVNAFCEKEFITLCEMKNVEFIVPIGKLEAENDHHPSASPIIRPHAEALLQQALKALEYHTQQTRPIEQTENVIASLRAHCMPQHAKQEQPRPSAIELQDAEIGIPEPVTELINPVQSI